MSGLLSRLAETRLIVRPAAACCPHCGYRLEQAGPFRFGNVRIDGFAVHFRGRPVALAPTQFVIVDTLVRAHGRFVTRDVLTTILGVDIFDRAICQYVKRARRTFLSIDPSFDQIEALRGFGAYRWRYVLE